MLQRPVRGAPGFGDHPGKGVEVDRHQVHQADAVALQLGQVPGLASPGQNPAVNAGMKTFYPPFQQFGKAGDLLYRRHRQACFLQGPGGAAGGYQLDTQLCQPPGKIRQTLFVVNAEQGAFNPHMQPPRFHFSAPA